MGAEPSRVAITEGFDDERGIARVVTLSILQALMDSKVVYEIAEA